MKVSKKNIKYVNEGYSEGVRQIYMVITTKGTKVYPPIFRKLPKCVQNFIGTHKKILLSEEENKTIYTYK